MSAKKNTSNALIFVASLFFVWGFVTVIIDSLVPRLKEIFELSYFQAGLVKFSFFLAYGLASIQAGKLLERIGFKLGMSRGLLIMGLGCLLMVPAALSCWYLLFLIGLFAIASGMTILQVAANPYICRLGNERTSSSRLNFTQGFNSLGATIAPILGAAYITGNRQISQERLDQLSEIQRIYLREEQSQALLLPFLCLGIGLLVIALILRHVDLPNTKLSGSHSDNVFQLLRSRRLLLGAIAIFVYVGSEVAIGSYLHNYIIENNLIESLQSDSILGVWIGSLYGADIFQLNPKKVTGILVAIYWGGALLGRFIGSGIQVRFPPARILTIAGLSAFTLLILAIFSHGLTAMWCLLCVGLFNSIMFPTIFALSIEGIKENLGGASGILCTAIVGGAIIPLAFGSLIDSWGFLVAFLLPGLCYLFIASFGAWTHLDSKKNSVQVPESAQVEAIVP